MSDGVSRNVNIKFSLDGREVVSQAAGINQAVSGMSSTLQRDFQQMEQTTDRAIAALANDIRSIDIELNRLARGVSRGSGIDQAEAITALTNRLQLLKSVMSQIAPDNYMNELSADAVVARSNLAHVETMLNRISSLQATIDNQRGIRGIYDRDQVMALNDPRFQNALIPQRPTGQFIPTANGAQEVLQLIRQNELDQKQKQRESREEERFYSRLEVEENRKKRKEEEDWQRYVNQETRREEQQFYQTLGQEEKRKAQTERSRLDDSLLMMQHRVDPVKEVNERLRPTDVGIHPAYGMVQAAHSQADVDERVRRAAELQARANAHYEEQRRNNNAAERQWIANNAAPPPTTKDQDREERIRRAKELDKSFDEHYRTQRLDNKAAEREWMLNSRQQSAYGIDGQNYDSMNRRQFIAQQAAFGLDDIVQQYMWSNSTASGISAAARAGGNNLTAMVGAMNVAPSTMIGGMLGIQGAAFAASSIAKYYDEIEKARVSTKELEKQLDSLQITADKELKFKYSLEDKTSKELKEDAKTAEREKESLETGKYKESAERVAKARTRLDDLDALIKEEQRNPTGLTVNPETGLMETTVDNEKLRNWQNEKASLKEEIKTLTPDATKYYDETARLEKEGVKRDEAIAKKAASEERATERKKKGDIAVDRFYKDIQDEEEQSGVMLTGDELRQRWDTLVQSNPHINLKEGTKQIDEKVYDKDRAYTSKRVQLSDKAMQEDEDYNSDRTFRKHRYGSVFATYDKRLREIDREYRMASPEERDMLKANARDKRDYDMSEQVREYDKSLRSGYRALSGITSGSEEEAQLRAKLTVDSGMKTEAEKQTKHLETIANNTKPRKPPTPAIMRIP